jgi:hypothetical protein
MAQLVPGRECGSCMMCCIVPAIDKPEVQKISGAVCRNCSDAGCAIYEARPQVCRNYYCGWRRLTLLPDDWRPDKSGVFVELESGNIPPQFNTNFALILILVANPLKTIREQRFCDFISRNVTNNIPMSMGLPGPNGKQCAQLPLNTKAMVEATRRSRAEVKAVLEKTLKRLQEHSFIPYEMKNSGYDFGT